jgi:hypothetical protein
MMRSRYPATAVSMVPPRDSDGSAKSLRRSQAARPAAGALRFPLLCLLLLLAAAWVGAAARTEAAPGANLTAPAVLATAGGLCPLNDVLGPSWGHGFGSCAPGLCHAVLPAAMAELRRPGAAERENGPPAPRFAGRDVPPEPQPPKPRGA